MSIVFTPMEDTNGTNSLVTTGLLTAWTNANAAFQMASAAIEAISSFVPRIDVSGDVTISPVTGGVSIVGLLAQKPDRPEETDLVFPVLPDMPNFNPIEYGDIPDMPEVDLVQLAIPGEVINTNIERYASDLLTEIKASLLDRITNGGTGLSPTIETAIWNRDEERALLVLEDAKTRANDEWAKRGFTLPNGVLIETINGIETEFINKRLETSRDISIKQAELEQTNVHQSLQIGASLEGQLMSYHSQFCELMLRASESLQKAKIEIYTAWTGFYKSYVESIKNYSEALSDRARMEVEINKDLLGRYGVSMEGYRIRVQAEVERVGALLKVYGADIQAYTAEAGAYQAIANVDVETLRARIQESLGRAQIQVATATENIRAAIAYAQVQVQALIAAGHTAAQLAAGAMAGSHVSAQVSSSIGKTSQLSGGEHISHNLTGKSNQGI